MAQEIQVSVRAPELKGNLFLKIVNTLFSPCRSVVQELTGFQSIIVKFLKWEKVQFDLIFVYITKVI